MFCKYCGNPIDEKTMKCISCGKPVGPLSEASSFRASLHGQNVPATPPREGQSDHVSAQLSRISSDVLELKDRMAGKRVDLTVIVVGICVLLTLLCLISVLSFGRNSRSSIKELRSGVEQVQEGVNQLQDKVEQYEGMHADVNGTGDFQSRLPENQSVEAEAAIADDGQETPTDAEAASPESPADALESPDDYSEELSGSEAAEAEALNSQTEDLSAEAEESPALPDGPQIKKGPEPVNAAPGENAVFICQAVGNNLEFIWEKQNMSTGEWSEIKQHPHYYMIESTEDASTLTSTLTLLQVTEDHCGNYRCRITDTGTRMGTVSAPAAFGLKQQPVSSNGPLNASGGPQTVPVDCPPDALVGP